MVGAEGQLFSFRPDADELCKAAPLFPLIFFCFGKQLFLIVFMLQTYCYI